MDQLGILIKNLKEYLGYANEAYEKGSYNTAVTLFFKALIAVCDIEIFRKTKIIPSSHESRFRMLEQRFPFLYRIADKDFPFYTDSYRLTLTRRIADMVKADVEKLIKEFGLDEETK